MHRNIRSTRLEVNLDTIEYNMRELKSYVGNSEILGVIKSDAYSNGALEVASTIMSNGASALAVSTLNEALELRKQFDYPILVLGFTEKCNYDLVVDNNITQTIYTLEQARVLNKEAMKKNKISEIHIKIDTGMNRLGFQTIDENITIIKEIYNMDFINIKGIFSHFAESEIINKSFTHKQYSQFIDFVKALENSGLTFPIKHISNWAAACDLPEYNLDMVRLGVPIFGVYSNYNLQSPKIDLKLSMTFKSIVSNVKTVNKGESISYNRKYFCQEDKKIATIPVGYADGYFQELGDKIGVYINGIFGEVVGKICMDQTMVDVTNIPNIKIGDEVILFDERSQHLLSARDIATIGRRVPKIYIKNNEIIKIKDYLL